MNKLRVEQWKNEPADLFVLRAFSKGIPHMSESELVALWNYVWQRSEAELLKRNSTNDVNT